LRALAIVLLLGACSPDASQRVHPRPADRSGTSAAPLALQDRDFLERAAKGGNAEVAIGALPEMRSSRAEVIAFGRMMVAQHTAANRQLAAIAAARKIALPESTGEQQHSYDELVEQRGDSFDRAFAKVMVEDHQQAAELYRSAASGVADPDLKAFAAATLPTIEAHLAQAKALGESVDYTRAP
jgi:putative membrane protein